MRYRAILAYDGTDYHGFQVQSNAVSVQGEIERALNKVSSQTVRITGAGRTDTGVHATGQVVAFDLEWSHPPDALQRALNATLPMDIALRELHPTHADFHPRFDALSRRYRYELCSASVRDPLRRRQAWFLKKPLNRDLLKEASAYLIGQHDFSTFGVPPQGNNPVRMITEAAWQQVSEDTDQFTITANAFLYRMVRSIVGTLVRVGWGQMTVTEFQGILAARNRSLSASLAPAHGLTLIAVAYEEETSDG